MGRLAGSAQPGCQVDPVKTVGFILSALEFSGRLQARQWHEPMHAGWGGDGNGDSAKRLHLGGLRESLSRGPG